VSKLPRTSIHSAAQRLQEVIQGFSSQHPDNPLVPLRIVAGDERNPVDYVFASVDPTVTQDPRPDLLKHVRRTLVAQGLEAQWRVGKGPDRTRRIHFKTDSNMRAKALQPKLSDHLNRKGYHFQRTFISKTTNRVRFDLLDCSSVDSLLQEPPVIDHQTICPSTPRYIQPVYGLEVAILSVKDSQLVRPVVNNYIRRAYGNVIAHSRLALDGDAYCVVFKTWAQTSRFLQDPFTAFDPGFGITHTISPSHARPALLYMLNSNGLPRVPCLSDDPWDTSDVRRLLAAMDLLLHTLVARTRALEILALREEQIVQQMQEVAQQTVAFLNGLALVISSSALHAAAATSNLSDLGLMSVNGTVSRRPRPG
jgi:hypothetical protein